MKDLFRNISKQGLTTILGYPRVLAIKVRIDDGEFAQIKRIFE